MRRTFLEPSAVRNLDKDPRRLHLPPSLLAFSSKPKQHVRIRKQRPRGFTAQTRDDGVSLDVIGQELGVTRERVRQIEKEALRKCRLWCIRHGHRLEDLLRKRLANYLFSRLCGVFMMTQSYIDILRVYHESELIEKRDQPPALA